MFSGVVIWPCGTPVFLPVLREVAEYPFTLNGFLWIDAAMPGWQSGKALRIVGTRDASKLVVFHGFVVEGAWKLLVSADCDLSPFVFGVASLEFFFYSWVGVFPEPP